MPQAIRTMRKSLVILIELFCAAGVCAGPAECTYVAETHNLAPSGQREAASYLLLKPSVLRPNTRGSLLIYLYGAGGSTQDYNLKREAYSELRRLLCQRGYFILVPELGPLHWMNQHARELLDAMMDQVLAEQPVDSHRVDVMGTSMGGGSAFAYAIHRPRLIRSVCSVLGMTDFKRWYAETGGYGGALDKALGGSPDSRPSAYQEISAMDHLDVFAEIPVFLIYGGKDTLVKPEHGKRLAAALNARNYQAVYREAKEVAHKDDAIVGFERELADFFDRANSSPRLDPESTTNPATQPFATSPSDRHDEIPGTNKVVVRKTQDGVRYGIWGNKPQSPAPTLFVLASTIEGTLGDDHYRQCGALLLRQGYLCVSIDLPCHGREQRIGEPEGLSGWRYRLDRGEPLIDELNQRLGQVLSDLIARGYTDPHRVAACGVSRGGFVALHFAAREPQIRCVAAFCPVTDLARLTEFKGAEQLPAVRSLALRTVASRLADRPVWIVIGDRDERVDTDAAIFFARSVSTESTRQKLPGRLELHVLPEPRGHTTPSGAFELAAAWISRQMDPEEKKIHEN